MPPEPASCRGLAASVVAWHRLHGRHDLPWQRSRDPYRVWLSEIMLQQTQVATAVPYYLRFLDRFPDVHALAAADVDAVLGAWSGLGYYSRARNLHRAAAMVAAQGWPDDVEGLTALPGVGRSTAAAIASFCFGRRAPILDGNVKRVFSRVFGVAATDASGVERLWSLAQSCIDDPSLGLADVPAYIQGLMDLGATVCARAKPACTRCPLSGRCTALATDAIARFPAARAPRAAPVRAYALLLLRRGAQVLLERRAPRGLWGGLWSLPVLCVDGDRPLEDAWRETLRRLAPATADPTGRTGPGGPGDRGDRGDPGDPGDPALPAAPVARFEHAFTHFRMRAEVWAFTLPDTPAPGRVDPAPVSPDPALVALDPALVALDPRDAHALAGAPLPKPVRSLLAVLGGG